MENEEKQPRPTDAAGNSIYSVPEANMEALKARIAKMNKRAAKLKMDPLVLTETGEHFETLTKRALDEETGLYRRYTIRLVLVTLTGNCPRVNGWAMAATIQHEDGGNLLRTVPGFETTLPLEYRPAGTACDHCNTDRIRKDTYVLQSTEGGWKQVGRNCLADFLRSENASGLAEYAEMLACLDEELGAYEDEGFGGGEGGVRSHYFTALALLTQVACCVRAEGWCSRTEAKNSYVPKLATVDLALACMDSKTFAKMSAKQQEALTPKDEDEAKATAAITWAQELAADVANDYLWNIRVVSHKEHIGYREAGLAGSIIAAYNRHMEQEMQRKYEKDHPSEWFGEVGKREVLTLTVIGHREMENDWGLTTLVTFRDATGNRAKWFCSGSCGLEVDKTYTVKATIKAHDEYKGSKQTTLSRVTEYNAKAEADAKAALKAARKAMKGRYDCNHDEDKRFTFVAPETEGLTKYTEYIACCASCHTAWTARYNEEHQMAGAA